MILSFNCSLENLFKVVYLSSNYFNNVFSSYFDIILSPYPIYLFMIYSVSYFLNLFMIYSYLFICDCLSLSLLFLRQDK